MQNSIFDAISVVAEAKVKSYKADQTIEASIIDTSHSGDGRYRVSYTGSEFDAYGAANSFYVGDVVYVTVPQGDFTKQKIIIGRKVDPQSLPSTTFNFKMPFDDFIPLRNLTGANEAPVAWEGQTIGYTANKEGRYIRQSDYTQVLAGTLNIDECKSCTYVKSANRWVDAAGNNLTEDQVKYIAGDGEEIAVNKDYVKKLKSIQAALNTLAQNYSRKAQVLQNNYNNLITLIEDVNYVFKEVEDESGTHQVRDYIKVISTGEAMGSSAYTIKWPDDNTGKQMNYLRAIQKAITTDFSIAPDNMNWVTKTSSSTALWNKIKNKILLPYMRDFIAGQYTKQVAEIDNNDQLTDEEKKARKAILVNADKNSSYEKLIPYFAWDSNDLENIKNTIKGRYETIVKYLEDEFYTGKVKQGNNEVQITYTDAYYLNRYPATVEGYANAVRIFNDELNALNAANRNLLWTWQGRKTKNILIETKLGISVDITTLLGAWEPTFGQYGLRFVIKGVTKTTDEDASQSIEETITFTNNDMYGNTYAYYTPYTQQKIFDISHLLTLDRIDCYFWQDFDFRDWGGALISPFYEDANEEKKYVDPNILVSNLKVLVGLTADEATTDRVLVYTYDDTFFGLSQDDQAKLGTKKLEKWKAGEIVRDKDPKTNDAEKTLQVAWIHIDEEDGPVLINHECLKHAADKQSLQYWKAKIYWYKWDWEYDTNDGVEADRMGGQSWRPLDQAPALEYLSTSSDNVIIKSWHDAHPDFDYSYSTENENFDIKVINDFTYLNQKYRAVVVANNKPYRSEPIVFTNRDATATGGMNTKLSSVILRFMKGKTTEDGTNFVIDEDLGGGDFFIYDENNNAGTDESGVPFSQVPYYVQIWTRNRETSDYQPASNDDAFGITDINWKSFGPTSMIANFQEPSIEEMENSVLTPITGDMTAEQIDWIKQITRKFYVRDRWDLAYMDNTIKVNMLYQGEPFTCEHECMFGNMGTMGSEFTIVLQQDEPVNNPMYLGGDFIVSARVYKRGIEVPDTSYFFGWEVLSPTWLTNYGSNSPSPKTKLFDDNSYDVHELLNIGSFWNNGYDTDETEGYQRNVFKARILNDMPLILRCTVSHAASYDLKVTKGFSLVNDAYFGRNLTVMCPNRVEYKSDGSAPLVDMGTFQIEKNYQESEELSNNELFIPSDKKVKHYGKYVTQDNGERVWKWYKKNPTTGRAQEVDKEEDAALIHNPISDDFLHPHWDLYAYTWSRDEDEEWETITDSTTGEETRRRTKVKPHGGPNPEADGSAGLMAGLSLQRTIGDGTEEEYNPEKHGQIITTESGDECLGPEFDRRIVTSDGKTYVTSKYVDYKFSPVSNKTSEGAEVDDLEYPSFWSTTGRPYKGPASWHWDPAYANKYYIFITWTKDVTAPGSYNPINNTYGYHHKFWFRQAIPLTQNVYSSSLLNSWDGSLLIDEVNNAILAQMIAAGTKTENNTFTGVIMGDWAKRGDSSLDVPGMYGLNHGEQVFGLRVNGTGYIGKSGKGRIIFDGNHGIIKNADGTCYLNLDPVIVRYKDGDLGERVSTGDLVIDNYSGTSQFFLYAETNATTDTAGTEAGNFAWAETIMRYAFGEEKHGGITQEGELVTRTSAKDIFVVDPSNGVLTTGGIYARYGRIGKYLLLNDAGISYMEGDTIDNKYFTTTYNLTNSENNNIIYIGQERRRDGSLITDTTNRNGVVVPAVREYDANYWSYLSYDKAYLEAHDPLYGREQNEVITQGSEKGRYIIWVGNIHPNTTTTLGAYPKFGVEHDGTVHMTEAYVQGEIHASALVIGDEDADEYDRNRGQKNFYSKVRKDHPEDILWQNPALLKKPLAGSNLYGTNSNGSTGGTCRKHYGDWLRPGDTWYITSEAIPIVSQFQGRGSNANAANPSYDNPYDLADTVVAITKYSITFNDNSGFQFQEVNKKDQNGNVIKEWVNDVDENGHVKYDEQGNPVRKQQNVKIRQIVYTGTIAYTKYTVETDAEEKKKGNYFKETSKTLDGVNVNTLEATLQTKEQAVATKSTQVIAAETAYKNNKTKANLTAWNNRQSELQVLQCEYKTYRSQYDGIYSKLEAWSKNINSTNNTALDKASYNASALIIEKLDNQQVSETSTDYPVPNPDSLGSADDAITSEGLSLQMSFTQLIWEGVQDTDNNHDWWGTWTNSNAGPSSREGKRILDTDLVVSDSNYSDGNDVPGLVHPKILTKTVPSSNGSTSEPIVAKRYSAPPGWRVVGDVNNDSIWDALRHANLTFNRTLHATTKLLTTNLRQSIADIMDKTGKSQKEALEELQRQRKELTNMLVHLQKDITDTVYNATADIRGGMDPITFFDDGNCYVFLTKYPIDSNVSGIGMVPAGLTIAQLATQSPDNVASTFYLNSKRMGFYRTYKETLDGSEINITVPLLSYYNGTMALAGSLFFGMDYNNYIRGTGLRNNLIGNDGNLVDSTEHPEDFSYTNGTITIYKNYLDGPNSRIVLGNGAIILDGEDNGKDVDGVANNWFAGVLKSDGTQKKGKQEGGRPYVYIGYGGVNIDENGNMLPATDKYSQGIIRVGKKDSSGLVAIADYDFISTSINSTSVTVVTEGDSVNDILGSGEVDITAYISVEKLQDLYPNWTTNIPTSSSYIGIQVNLNNHIVYWVKDDGALVKMRLPTTYNGDGSSRYSTIYYREDGALFSSMSEQLINPETLEQESGTNKYFVAVETPNIAYIDTYYERRKRSGNWVYTLTTDTEINTAKTYYVEVEESYALQMQQGGYDEQNPIRTYANKVQYSKNNSAADLTYTILLTKLATKGNVGGSETDTTDLGGFKVTYTYKYSAVYETPRTVPINGDVLKILQHTNSNQDTGVGIVASNEDINDKDGYIVFSPYNNKTLSLNTGYDASIDNKYHWLIGWNFKGFNIYSNNIFVSHRLYVKDAIGIYDSTDNRYYFVATHKWVYEAIADFMDGPIKSLAKQIADAIAKARAAMAKAIEAYNQAIYHVAWTNVDDCTTHSFYYRFYKINGQMIAPSMIYGASRYHKHAITITLNDDGTGSGTIGYPEGGAGITVSGPNITNILKNYYTKSEVDEEVKKAFKNGWEAAVAAAQAAKIRIVYSGTSNNASGSVNITATLTIPGNNGSGASGGTITRSASKAYTFSAGGITGSSTTFSSSARHNMTSHKGFDYWDAETGGTKHSLGTYYTGGSSISTSTKWYTSSDFTAGTLTWGTAGYSDS